MGDRVQANYSIHNYVEDAHSSFSEKPFNEVDGLVLTQIANMDLGDSGIDLYSGQSKSFAEIYQDMMTPGTPAHDAYNRMGQDNQQLLKELASSERYQNMSVSNYVKDPSKNNVAGFASVGEEQHMEQFAAVTITYKQGDKTYNYVSYQATDGSTDGWAEDAAMLYSMNTQAQSDSVAYMNAIGERTEGYITGGGHSKGGGDFEYAFLFCNDETRDRIVKGYVYDSPGLTDEVLSNTTHYDKYTEITDGSYICPQDSIIGQVLHENDNATFVHSVEKGFNEHDPYSWEIDPESGTFVPDEQTELSKYINSALDKSVKNMSQEQREAFFKFVEFILYNSGSEGIDGLGKLFGEGWKTEDGKFNWSKVGEIWDLLSEDWAHMTKEERREFIKSLGSAAAGFASATYDKVKHDVDTWFNEKIAWVRNKYDGAVKAVQNWVIDRKNEFLGFLESAVAEYTAQMQSIKQFLKETFDNNYKAAQEYLSNNRLLQFDTGELYGLAQRLWAINGRLEALDHRMDNLYKHFKWSDLGKIIKVTSADLRIGWSPKINNCADWLRDTAQRFETAEQEILNMLG